MKLPNGRLRPFKATYQCNGITYAVEILAKSHEAAIVAVAGMKVAK